ncbi:CDP-glycerol--glycerophosphate glycerophosphotransferase [Pseudoalteromonas sp. NCCP-2140]|uniref:CDP-glycerol glycerophosphotransferase family protein n=1 Tax=Pseudoalteromonas sp. NCCP-2140 TaxID=2942288 RepID=UPI00203F6AF2|nr:CDP-glycerol glycerophosphotransferase family protein [Pseudoalteromonas sp. NCCP-2140]GKW52534.1 CDP-glycerol--glycerophosphate glycerophosphotransferase [Pseudoalteromonas sp. NCCP-2140]
MDYLAATANKKYLMYISQNYSYAILRPLQREILARGGEVRWFLEGNEINPDFLQKEEQRLMSLSDVKEWQPDVVYLPGNVVPNFIPGKKVKVFHGFNSGKRVNNGLDNHFKIRDCFDLYCTQGPSTTTTFIELAQKHGYFQVKETGWPTLDPFFSEIENNPYKNPNDNRKTLLICSTFSKRLSLAPKLYEQIKAYSEQGKWRILVQFHPKMPSELVDKYKALQNDNLTFVETDNVLPLLQAADTMLCDTSSILLMFILQRKPVVTFCNQAPGEHLIDVTDVDKLTEAIDYAFTRPAELMAKIEHFCQQLHPYQDGLSSQRVLAASNELLLSNPALKPKPRNFIRNFKMRRKLNYWRW